MTTVLTQLQSAVQQNRRTVAIDAKEPVTYASLWSQTERFAGGLRDRDVGTDEPVVICVSDPTAALTAFYGTLRNGSVPVMVPSQFSTAAIRSVLDDTGASLLVLEGRSPMSLCAHVRTLRTVVTLESAALGIEFDAFLENDGIVHSTRTGVTMASRADTDRALIAYVDQHEDEPLGVVYTHSAVRAGATVGRTLLGESVGHHLGVLPLTRPIELCYGVTATLFDGGTYCPIDAWEPTPVVGRFFHDIDRLFCTPDQYQSLRTAGLEPGTDGVAVIEPTPSAASGHADGTTRFCGVPETGLTHVRTVADIEADRVGRVLSNVETTVLAGEEGTELAVSGPTTMESYYHQPELTAQTVETLDGTAWIRTGVHATAAGEIPSLEQAAEPIGE